MLNNILNILERWRPRRDKKMTEPCFPQEIFDAIIDQLKDDTDTLKEISLASTILSPRTRVHLFSSANLASKTDCARLRKLITQSPHLARYFTSLTFEFHSRSVARSLPAKILRKLVNLRELTLTLGDFSNLRPSVISALGARSYTSLALILIDFDSVTDICSLTHNSPSLKTMHIVAPRFFGPDVPCDHEDVVPSPTSLSITDTESDAGTILGSILSPRQCPISMERIDTLLILISHTNPALIEQLNHFLDEMRVERALTSFHVTHTSTGTHNICRLSDSDNQRSTSNSDTSHFPRQHPYDRHIRVSQ
ncbi:uncharacterized protein EV420DRAFT_1209022 [Desarmillaria tabescens]|uniref:Uncharacterized protein n=1 Tax=Armillaria tabescens TaxID=1929756 RepID=A0AA39JBZ4_ARMTA|nr:uncharacterized protein EV420DRAFT_1209022 [Desarmillaria tabescens]KAK0438519.1 hypothetical protein EV420DRAFT_1209022 [Desarmillaria tabescens]